MAAELEGVQKPQAGPANTGNEGDQDDLEGWVSSNALTGPCNQYVNYCSLSTSGLLTAVTLDQGKWAKPESCLTFGVFGFARPVQKS